MKHFGCVIRYWDKNHSMFSFCCCFKHLETWHSTTLEICSLPHSLKSFPVFKDNVRNTDNIYVRDFIDRMWSFCPSFFFPPASEKIGNTMTQWKDNIFRPHCHTIEDFTPSSDSYNVVCFFLDRSPAGQERKELSSLWKPLPHEKEETGRKYACCGNWGF